MFGINDEGKMEEYFLLLKSTPHSEKREYFLHLKSPPQCSNAGFRDPPAQSENKQ